MNKLNAFYIYVEVGKLNDEKILESFRILGELNKLSSQDKRENISSGSKIDFISQKFSKVPVRVNRETVDQLIEEFELNIDDVSNKLSYKKFPLRAKLQLRGLCFPRNKWFLPPAGEAGRKLRLFPSALEPSNSTSGVLGPSKPGHAVMPRHDCA